MEDIKKRFIVDEGEFSKKKIDMLVGNIVDFVKIGKGGRIFIEINSINIEDKIALSIIARFLAIKIDKNISQEISLSEIIDSLSLPQNMATARISDLVKKGLIHRVRAGKYVAVPHRLEKIIKKLNKKYKKNG